MLCLLHVGEEPDVAGRNATHISDEVTSMIYDGLGGICCLRNCACSTSQMVHRAVHAAQRRVERRTPNVEALRPVTAVEFRQPPAPSHILMQKSVLTWVVHT